MATENFTTYTEVDPNTRIAVTSSRVTWASVARNEDAYVYKDKGADYFNSNFTVLLAIRVTAADDGSVINYWALANLVDDDYDIQVASGDYLSIRQTHAPFDDIKVVLREVDGGSSYESSSYVLTPNTTYYLKIVRDESAGTYGTLYLYIYSDSGRTSLLSTLSLALHSSKKDFRYIYAFQSHNSGFAHDASGYTENLEIKLAPTVTTDPASSVEATTVTLNGTLDADGGEACDCGFEYGLDTGYGTTTPTESKETGETFSQAITGLSANTLYHFRAIATNSVGTGYGDDRTFIICSVDGAVFATQAELDAYLAAQSPTVTTQAMTEVGSTTATGNGNVTDLGGAAVTQHGHCWSTSHDPTTSDNKTELGAKSEIGAFPSSLTDLTPGTTYYVRAYATNAYGASYGSEVTLMTKEVTTDAATNVKETSATLNGTLDDDGGEACDVRFQYGFTTDYGTNTDWQSGKETEDTFSQAIAELVGGTLYHFRAQARNGAGTANGNDRTFTTITPFVKKRAHSLARDEL